MTRIDAIDGPRAILGGLKKRLKPIRCLGVWRCGRDKRARERELWLAMACLHEMLWCSKTNLLGGVLHNDVFATMSSQTRRPCMSRFYHQT